MEFGKSRSTVLSVASDQRGCKQSACWPVTKGAMAAAVVSAHRASHTRTPTASAAIDWPESLM